MLPGQEFLDGQRVATARVFERQQAAAATTSALRRITQRVVPGAGRSGIVSGLPSGPTTSLAFGRGGSNMTRLAHPPAMVGAAPKKFPTSIPTSRLNLRRFHALAAPTSVASRVRNPTPLRTPIPSQRGQHSDDRGQSSEGLPIGIRISWSAPQPSAGDGSDARDKVSMRKVREVLRLGGQRSIVRNPHVPCPYPAPS
jgi:hypothetical protein